MNIKIAMKYRYIFCIYVLVVIYMAMDIIITKNISSYGLDGFEQFSYIGMINVRDFIRIFFYIIFAILVIKVANISKSKADFVKEIILIDVPALLAISFRYYSHIISAVAGGEITIYLNEVTARYTLILLGSILIGMECVRYIEYFKHKS